MINLKCNDNEIKAKKEPNENAHVTISSEDQRLITESTAIPETNVEANGSSKYKVTMV